MIGNPNSTNPSVHNADPHRPVDATAVAQVARGGASASIKLTGPQFGGKTVDRAMLDRALAAAKVTYGVDETQLISLSVVPDYSGWIDVAHMTPAEDGENATLDFTFPMERDLRPKEREDGTVDYYDLNIVENVNQGDLLCTRTPPTSGKPGMTVLGTAVPAKPGRDRPLPVGRNTKPSPDGRALYATLSGQPQFDGRIVSVQGVFEMPGDVGVATGNIHFVGNVVIKGSVTAGYKVEAGGSIDVFGVVEGGTLISGGDVTIRSGMKNRASVQAERNVTTRFVESSQVYCGGNLIAESLIHSKITCRNNITLSGGKGVILGGHVLAGQSVSARTIGSASAAPLVVELSPDPVLQHRERDLHKLMAELDTEIKKLEQLNTLFIQLENANRLTPDKNTQMQSVQASLQAAVARKYAAEEELASIAGQLVWQDRGFVQCTDRIYHGTRLQMGKYVEVLDRDWDHCRFAVRDGAILSMPF
jgi:hypothetical protein